MLNLSYTEIKELAKKHDMEIGIQDGRYILLTHEQARKLNERQRRREWYSAWNLAGTRNVNGYRR